MRSRKGEEEEKITVADAVRVAITSKAPYLECLRDGVVNYTWLAEKIMRDVMVITQRKKVNIDAIKAALIRYQQDLQREEEALKSTVGLVLSRSTVELQNDITVLTLKREAIEKRSERLFRIAGDARFFNLNQGKKIYTVVISSEDCPPLLSLLDEGSVVDRIDGQSVLIVISPYEIVSTPGVVSFITRLLYINGINVTQLNSSYTDTIIIVPKELSTKAYDIMRRAIEEFRAMMGQQKP